MPTRGYLKNVPTQVCLGKEKDASGLQDGECPFYCPPLFLDEQQLTSLSSYLPSLSLTHQSSFYFCNCISPKRVKANFSCVPKIRPHYNSYLQGHVPVTNRTKIDSQFKTEALPFLWFTDLGGAESKQMLLGCDSAACIQSSK